MRDTLFIWVEAYEYPSGLRIEAFIIESFFETLWIP